MKASSSNVAFSEFGKAAQPGKKRGLLITILATLIILALLIVLVVLLITLPSESLDNTGYLHYYAPSNSVLGHYDHAAVATDHYACSQIGREILQQNGSAVDAAIAALLCLGVMNPSASGIGGGSLNLIYNKKDGQVLAVDSREAAPLASNQTMFVNLTGASYHGNMAIAVPGEIAGYYAMWSRFGRLEWRQLFEPAINMCLNGVPVSRPLADSLSMVDSSIREYKNLREMYINASTNSSLREGQIRYDPLFAKTLQRIAQDPFTFYNGSLADDILADVCEDTGTFSCIFGKDDLPSYKAKWREVPSIRMQSGHQVHMFPLPSSASILAPFLNVFDLYGMSVQDFKTLDSTALFYHRQTEVSKFAFAERVYLGDPDFSNLTENVERLLSKSYAEYIKQKINDSATNANQSYYLPPEGASFVQDDAGTSHVSIIDKDGNAVSATSTVNTRFGSLIRGTRTGIQFNNEMDDFSSPDATNTYNLPPGPNNFPEPGKRPLSSMDPLILMDSNGDLSLAIGASGGPRILSGTIETLLRVHFLNDDLKQATDAPRLHHQYLPNILYYEPNFSKELIEKLKTFGHETQQFNDIGGIGTVQTAQVLASKKIDAHSDSRKYSAPDGFIVAEMHLSGFGALLVLKYALLAEDIVLNSFMTMLNLSPESLIVMGVIQCAGLVLAIIALFISFFSTFICQAGLMSFLCRKFASTIAVMLIYLVLTVIVNVWNLSVRWPNNYANVWSTGYSALYGIHRCFAVVYYFYYKRTALRLGDGHFYEDAEWIRLEFERRR